MPGAVTNDAFAVALQALAWTLADDTRAERLVALTGLTPADLRTRLDEPATLAAVLGFVAAHEPDLIACAATLDLKPEALVTALQTLEQA